MGEWLAQIENSLKGKTAVVTGGSRGIGKEIALAFAGVGANVALLDVLEEEGIQTARALEEKGVKSSYYLTDITDGQAVAAVFEQVVSAFGSIDILVNNAGITRDGLLLRMKEEDWNLVLDVNLKGAFHGIKGAAKYMAKQRSGKIVNIASVIGLMGNPGQANYSASKAGLIGLTKTSAKEFASRGIRVNAVAPGFIATDMTEKLPENVREGILAQVPLAKLGSPGDVANAVLFLASSLADYITGQVIVVDGGMVM